MTDQTQNEANDEQPASVRLFEMITGHWVTAALHAAARLGIADRIPKGGAAASDALAEAVGAHPQSVYRLLRALASRGLFEERGPRQFALTELGEHLRADHAQSVRAMALFQGAPPHWGAWGSFLHAVRTGDSAFTHVHGMGFFDYCKTDEEFAAHFNAAMTGMSAAGAEAVVEAYDFAGIGTLCDVGGGQGMLLAEILAANPQLRGILFDLPRVVAGAAERLTGGELSDRCEIVGGDFFKSLPAADAYVSKHIIHDWSDDECVKILENMREAMQGDGRVLLVEAVIPPGDGPFLPKLLDLEMLNSTHGGRERTEAEFAELFNRAGLKLNRVVKTKSFSSVIEAIRA